MLFQTSLIGVVMQGTTTASPRRLRVLNTTNGATISELNFVTAVLGVRMNRQRLLVCLENKIHVYDMGNLKQLHTVETAPNPRGLFTLSPNADVNSFAAYPGSKQTGEVVIMDTLTNHAISVVTAHYSPLACMAFNYDGTMLATASDKGTVIRVFAVPEGTKMYTFRRGSYPTTVYGVSFNLSSSLLCCSCASGTIHIFKVDGSASSAQGVAAQASSVVRAYLPETIGDMWEPERNFAHVKVKPDLANVAAINSLNSAVHVLSADGVFASYALDATNGGECKLASEHSVLDVDDAAAGSAAGVILQEEDE